MKTKLEIFSTEPLSFFFTNLNEFFEISIKSLEDLKSPNDKKNLSIVFLDNNNAVFKKAIKNICENENFIFICSDFSVFQKFSLNKKNTFISPFSINKLVDIINNFVNTRKHTFANIELKNNSATNIKTSEKIDGEFDAISKYCVGSCHNIFGQDRMDTNPEFIYNFDILNWMNTRIVLAC